MKTLIVYDSVYGNTEKIATAIRNAIVGGAKALRISVLTPEELKTADILIVGSPTHGGKPTQAIQDFLDKALAPTINGKKVAAFDTRVSGKLTGLFGYAADRIANGLAAKEGTLISPPVGFIVTGKEGPLKEGELERAVSWARSLPGGTQ